MLLLSFSGAYLLGVTSMHLIPEAFSGAKFSVGYWLLGGFFLQIILEQLSLGVEHGHMHSAHKGKSTFAFQVMLGLCVHAFVEGLPLEGYHDLHQMIHPGEETHKHLLFGIALHHIPASFALAMLLKLSGFQRNTIIGCLLFFAAMSPAGAFVGSKFTFEPDHFRMLLALVVGVFLHISTTILFEMDDNAEHHIHWKKFAAILLGVALALISV